MSNNSKYFTLKDEDVREYVEEHKRLKKHVEKDHKYHLTIFVLIGLTLMSIFGCIAIIMIIIGIELNFSNFGVNKKLICNENCKKVTVFKTLNGLDNNKNYENTRLYINNSGSNIILRNNETNTLEFLNRNITTLTTIEGKNKLINTQTLDQWEIKSTEFKITNQYLHRNNFITDNNKFNLILYLNENEIPSVLINQNNSQILNVTISGSIWRQIFTVDNVNFNTIYISNVINQNNFYYYFIETWTSKQNRFYLTFSQFLIKFKNDFFIPGGLFFYYDKLKKKNLYIYHIEILHNLIQ